MASIPLGQDGPEEAPTGGRQHVGFGLTPRAAAPDETPDPPLSLDEMVATVDDGLLMVLGPEDDPVPPWVFAAAAAESPGAPIRLHDGRSAPADKVAAALRAQSEGRLAGEGVPGERWIMAMLGLGTGPETVSDNDLTAEAAWCEVTTLGQELLLSPPAGAALVLADARASGPSAAADRGHEALMQLRGEADDALRVRDLVGRLRRDVLGPERADGPSGEAALFACRLQIVDDALVLAMPIVGDLRLTPADDALSRGPYVSVFAPDGQAASMPDLLSALQRDSTGYAAAVRDEASAADPADDLRGDAAGLASEPAPPRSREAPARPIPLSVDLPTCQGVARDDVAVVMIAGLPDGAALSAGVADGNGTWALSPADLEGLSLTLPARGGDGLTLEVTSIAVTDRAGQLASARSVLRVPLAAVGDDAPTAGAGDDVPTAMVTDDLAAGVGRAAAAGMAGERTVPIPLDIAPELIAAGGGAIDAVLIRDVPPGAVLSAGVYEPAIDGWVVLPAQLAALAITPASAQRDGFALTVMAVSLKSARPTARVLTHLRVASA